MKKLLGISFLLLFISNSLLFAQSNEKLLKEAIYLEEVSGNLEEAMVIFNSIVATEEASRKVKAQALLHLGLANEKLGNQKAQKYYQKIVDQFSDQKEYSATARTRLNYIVEAVKPGRLEKKFQSTTKKYARPDIYGTISNDGLKVSYVNWDKGNLAIYDVASDKSMEITTDGSWSSDVAYSDMSIWSPDNKHLAYLWLSSEGGELRIYNTETKTNETVLPVTKDKFPYPIAWTNNNKILINYGSFDRLTWSYNLFDPKDRSLQHLHTINTNDLSTLEAVNISPDGEYMIYYFKDNGNNYCNVHKTGDFNNKPLSIIENVSNKPFWSPNMDKIYFTRSKFNNTVLLEAKFDNGNVNGDETLVVENLPEEIAQMTIDPNNRSLHYVSIFNQFTIYKTELDWTQRKFKKSKIEIEAVNGLSGPSWSPDGNSFVYIKSGGNNWIGSKIVLKNISTNQEREYDLGIKSLEINYFLTNMHWSPSGRHLLVSFMVYDEKDIEHQRMALLNLENGSHVKFEQDIVRPSITLLSNNDIYYFEKGRGIIHFNIEKNSKELVYELESSDEMIAYLKRNKNLDQIVFYKSPSSEMKDFNELIVLNLSDNSSKTVLRLSEDKSFMYGDSPQLVNNDTEILVPIRDNKKDSYRFYTVDATSQKLNPFGDEMSAEVKNRWLHLSLDNSEKNMLYLKMLKSANAWTINDF